MTVDRVEKKKRGELNVLFRTPNYRPCSLSSVAQASQSAGINILPQRRDPSVRGAVQAARNRVSMRNECRCVAICSGSESSLVSFFRDCILHPH